MSTKTKKSGKNNRGGRNKPQKRSSRIRILVKCSWSGARLSPTPDFQASTNPSTTIQEIISNLSLQLPSAITSVVNAIPPNGATDAASTLASRQPSIVYMRKSVSKNDWVDTTIGDLLGDDVSCDSIMLTLNLPKNTTPAPAVAVHNDFNAASASIAAAGTTVTAVAALTGERQEISVSVPVSTPIAMTTGIIQQDSVMTPVSDDIQKDSNDGDTGNDDDDGAIAEPMDIDEEGVDTAAAAATTATLPLATDTTPIMTTITASAPPARPANATKNLTIEEAIQNILSSNFDSLSIEYFKTTLKILDNILSTPTPSPDASFSTVTATATTTSLSKNIKVRTLRLTNATVQKKIVEKKHGLDLLLHVIGFEYQLSQQVQVPSLSNNNNVLGFDFDRSSSSNNTNSNNQFISSSPSSSSTSDTIVLLPSNENQHHIQSARNVIAKVLVEQLNIPPGEIPTPPSMKQQAVKKAAPNAVLPFDPYKAHAYNTQSAANGVPNPNSVIPGKRQDEKSTTERQLEILQKKQKELEQNMQSKLHDRNIIAVLPGVVQGPIVTLQSSNNNNSGDGGFLSTTTTKGDSSLIAIQMKKREEERKKREEGGFTTKAMRDLEKMKKQKVYSHAQLRIYFPDGSRLEAKFLPNECMSVVKKVVSSSFVPMMSSSTSLELKFDLYVSPPRRILNDKKNLTEEGLVPAAKIHVSWKDGYSPPAGSRPGSFLQLHLFEVASIQLQQQNSLNQNKTSFPESKPLTETEDSGNKKLKASNQINNGSSSSAAGPKDTLASREEEMIKRMMGKKKGGLSRALGRGTNSGNGGSEAGKGNKPKWFSKK